MEATITYEQFEKVDIRVGRIVEVTDFERARFPTYKLKVDFGGETGVKQSSARFKENYRPDELLDRQCLAVVNLGPKNIAGYLSEVLVLGVPAAAGGISLLSPVHEAELGGRLY